MASFNLLLCLLHCIVDLHLTDDFFFRQAGDILVHIISVFRPHVSTFFGFSWAPFPYLGGLVGEPPVWTSSVTVLHLVVLALTSTVVDGIRRPLSHIEERLSF